MSARRRELWLVLAAATALLYALVVRIDPAVVPPQWDEFILLTNARRVFAGQRPFVDYVWFLPPASESLYALWFALSGGPSAGTARLFAHLLVVATTLAWYAGLRGLRLPPLWAAACALALPALFYPVWAIPLHHWTAQFFLSLAALALALGLRASSTAAAGRWLALSGAAWALTALSVQTQGALGLALLGGLWWRAATEPEVPGPAAERGRTPHRAGSRVGAFLLGAAVPTAALLFYLVTVGALSRFVQAAVLYVLGNYHQQGGVNDMLLLGDLSLRLSRLWQSAAPLGIRLPLVVMEFATPLLTGALVLVSLTTSLQLALRAPAGQRLRELWAVPALGVGGLVFLVRPDVMHLAFFGSSIAVACVLHIRQLPPEYGLLRRPSLTVWLGAVVLGLLIHHGLTLAQGARPVPVFRRVQGVDPALDGLRWVDARMIAQSPLLLALRRHHVQFPEHRLLAVPEGAVAYFLAMPPAVPDTLLLPASARYDGPVEYGRTLAALRARPAEVFVLTSWQHGRGFLEPPAWADDQARALAAFLVDNYALRARLGDAQVYALRSPPPAAVEAGSRPSPTTAPQGAQAREDPSPGP